MDPARRSTLSLASNASLRANADIPAGTPRAIPLIGWDDTLVVPPTSIQPFYKKRWFIISQIILIPLGIALLFIVLFPVVRAIVQLVVKRSELDVKVAVITQPQNTTFKLGLQGIVTHTGIFSAKIQFTEPIRISWVEDGGTETPLGTMTLDVLSAKRKQALIDQNTTFIITDQAEFGRFSSHLITSQNFTWRLQSNNLRVQALKFPLAKGVSFDKTLTLNGFNNFDGNIVLRDLQLPSDDPTGGINFVAVTEILNPSPFSLSLGTVVFALSYQNTSLGVGTGANTIILPGTNQISLSGTLVKQTGPASLAALSQLFTNYLNGESSPVVAQGQSTLQPDGSIISWLSQGLQSLKLNVPFKPFAPIDPIRTISIGDLSLKFDKESSWTPAAESHTVRASLQLPFGFNLAIDEIQNHFNIVKDGNAVAGLSTPLGASTSSISVLSHTATAGIINITIMATNLSCPDPQHPAFAAFNTDLTTQDIATFFLVGQSRAIANLSIGQITLDPIKVNVSTSLQGLQGLKGMTTIENVDVTGGTQTGINLGIKVSIFNPSSLNLATGDLIFQLLRDGVVLGTALLPGLTLQRGNNSLSASSNFQANNSPQGLQTLNDFVGKKDVQLVIAGFDGSTEMASLVDAFKSIDIQVTLPGLKTDLLNSAALKVLPTTGQNNISHVVVFIANPFSAPLAITKVKSTVKAFGIVLGSISSDASFTCAPKSTTVSPALHLDMNFDPAALFTVTRALAVEAGLNVAPLDSIVQLGGIQYLTTTGNQPSTERRGSIFSGFDLPTFVQTAFKKLRSDVELSADVTIGDYKTTLQYTQNSVPTTTDDSLDLVLPVLARPIVQKVVGESVLGIDTVLITNPQQISFGTQLKGSISNSGPFDATIAFPSGLMISWQGKPLGKIKMQDINIAGDVGASLDYRSDFQVTDVDHLTKFTKILLNEESFDWDISGDNLTVTALGIEIPGITFSSRRVTLKGFDGLKNGVLIKSFDLPFNDPAGGIHLTLQAITENPSQVGIELDSIDFNTFVGDVMIAPVTTTGTIILAPGTTSNLSLVGRLLPQTSASGLASVSDVFNNFIQGRDSQVIVQGSSAGSGNVTWLNEGIKSLRVSTALPNQGPLTIIKSISLNQLQLMFTPETSERPSTSSKSTDATFALPFGFPLDIPALKQTITIGFEGVNFAQLAIPKGPSTTDVEARVIHLAFQDVPLTVFNGGQSTFSKFVAATTAGGTQTISLSGTANADAQTAVGLLTLTNIPFAVKSNLQGLQGLNARPAIVGNIDVNHGFPEFLLIKVDAALFNPSNLTIGAGDVSFPLRFQDQTIGSADISNLVVVPGNASYPIDVHYAPQGGAVGAGQTLLQNFLQGTEASTSISGSIDSTSVDSLKLALSQIHLSPVIIPGLHQTLIKSVSLTFPPNIVQTGVASTSFTLSNPFTAGISLLEVGAIAAFQGLNLGKISKMNELPNPIQVKGHSDVTSPNLPLQFNLDPSTIIELLLLASKQNGVSLGPLNELFQFIIRNPHYRPPVTSFVDTQVATCVSGKQFDAATAILKSLSGLKVDLNIEASVKLDDFATNLAFNQNSVPAITDQSALFLVGAVAGPIAQHLVDGSELAFTAAYITNISDDGFDLALKGSLTNIGPLDALITFTEPLTVNWQGKDIARITLQPICAEADIGVPDYEINAQLTITDLTFFTEFATFLLHNPSFDWTISSLKLQVTALGTVFHNVSLSKVVTFKAFNGLPGVTISNFQLPSDDIAGGIHIETDALIPSVAQLGIDLGTVTFNTYFQGTFVGPLSARNLYLQANMATKTHLSGRIVPQSGSDVAVIGTLFSGFLAGQNSTLETRGDSVQPAGSIKPVTWLSTAFKSLSLSVSLPGEKRQVIQSILLNDLEVTLKLQDQTFAPPTSSESTLATYKNPFGFSLQVVESGQTLVLSSQGTDLAQLDLPKAPANGGISTGNAADLVISFREQPLRALNEATFGDLFTGIALSSSLDITLKGVVDVTARTPIGDVLISGIPFDVPTQLKGIDSFGGSADLSDVSVAGSGGKGGNEYIVAPLTTALQNPSNISLSTVDVTLPVVFQGVKIGRAAIPNFNLKPGRNYIPTEFHYVPDNANDTVAQSFLTQFIQTNNQLGLTIHGDLVSSPFASLQSALSNLRLLTHLKGFNQPTLITHITVTITLDSLVTNMVSVDFDVHNPLNADLVLEVVQSDAGVNGEIFAQFSQPFSSFVVPPGRTVNSGTFGNVLLTQGAIASLGIIPLGILDIAAASTVRIGQGGYEVPWLKLNQRSVPTTYNLALSSSALMAKAVEISANNTSSSASFTYASSSTSVTTSLSSRSSVAQNLSIETHSGPDRH